MAATCSWCDSGEFDPGFLLDSGQGSHGYGRWIPGPIEVGALGGAKIMGKQKVAVQAHRCRSCGHLELFAVDPG